MNPETPILRADALDDDLQVELPTTITVPVNDYTVEPFEWTVEPYENGEGGWSYRRVLKR